MTRGELVDLVLAAAEQHGLDDADGVQRQVADLERALRVVVLQLNRAQLDKAERELKRTILAGWVTPAIVDV